MNTSIVYLTHLSLGDSTFFAMFTSLVLLVHLVGCCKRFNHIAGHVTCMLITEVIADYSIMHACLLAHFDMEQSVVFLKLASSSTFR